MSVEGRNVIVCVPDYGPGDFEGEYLDRRNTAVGERIAVLLGGRVCDVSESSSSRYFIPHAALTKEASTRMGISTEEDLFGGVVEIASHRDKAILHTLVKDNERGSKWHSSQFAESVERAVLPGFTTFSLADATKALYELKGRGYGAVRCKDPTQDGSGGQWVVSDDRQLKEVVRNLPDEKI